MKPKTVALTELLTEWHEAVAKSEEWATKEKALRVQIFAVAFPEPTIGKNKIHLPHDMALIGDYRMNYRIDRAGLEAAAVPSELLESVVNYRPEIRAGAWRELSDQDRLLFADFVTETPGTPGLEIKHKSKVRW